MKCICTVFATLLIFISAMAPTAANEADWLPDANLRTAVRSALSIADDAALTQQDMQDLTSFTARNSQISNITGLEHATALTVLDIRDNTVTDVNPLSALTHLELLRLKGNTLSDISPLSGLTNLTLLNLRLTGISSVSALSGLTHLEHLRVDDNSITDVEPLTSLTNLRRLWIAGNDLTNAHLLSSLTNLSTIDIRIPDSPETSVPDVGISVPSEVQNGAFDVHIGFTETVSEFDREDLLLGGTASADITAWNGTNNTVFTAEITPTTSGELTLDIDADVAIDEHSNGNTAAATQTVTVDVDAPTVVISVPPDTQTNVFDVTITFSETVSVIPKDSLEISGDTEASITNWRWNAGYTVFRAEITPTTSGTLTFNVAADITTDAANNPNTAATPETVTVEPETTSPTVSIFVPTVPQSTSRFLIYVAFSEEVTDFDVSDLSLEGSTATATVERLYTYLHSDGSYRTYFRITPETSGDFVISVPAGVVEDVFGNPNTASEEYTIPIDSGVPNISIFDYTEPSAGVFTIIITFSEEVSDFVQEDLVLEDLEHGADVNASITSWVTTDNIVFTAVITVTSSGRLAFYVPEGVATDADGNLNTASHWDSDYPDYVIDVDPPTVVVSEVVETQTGAFKVTINFSEPVSDFAEADISLADSTADATITRMRVVYWGDYRTRNTRFKVTITPTTSGTVAISIPADVCTDKAGNPNTASETHTVTVELPGGGNAPSAVLSRITNLLDTTPLASLDLAQLEEQLQTLRVQSDGSAEYLEAIALLERTVAALRPEKTVLLANYPNPFNPETWIPYHLANAGDVRITVYDTRGSVVRQLDLGHQREGYYTSRSRAAYWDGRNDFGERVASGIYFYQFQADNRSLLRKMLILK